jgi:hypothetical protein
VAKLNKPKVVMYQMVGDNNTSNSSIYNTQAMVDKSLSQMQAGKE